MYKFQVIEKSDPLAAFCVIVGEKDKDWEELERWPEIWELILWIRRN
ncbi:hypothetical protein ES703_56498 [subsurface metagenome]